MGEGNMPKNHGLWFSVEGTGDVLAVSTCVPNPMSGDIDFPESDNATHVYDGDCASLPCVAHNDDTGSGKVVDISRESTIDKSCQPLSYVQWHSEKGTNYYILLRSWDAAVNFFFSVHTFNDSCEKAESLELGETPLI